MKVTRETDYAIRIVLYLSKQENIVGAKQISADTDITPRFALKILRKLCIAQILKSYKGNMGGYRLNKKAEDINMKQVIEAIDGTIAINDCLDSSTAVGCNSEIGSCEGSCAIRAAFKHANDALIRELESKTFDKLN